MSGAVFFDCRYVFENSFIPFLNACNLLLEFYCLTIPFTYSFFTFIAVHCSPCSRHKIHFELSAALRTGNIMLLYSATIKKSHILFQDIRYK